MSRKRVAIVGTRRISEYGEHVTAKLARELAAHGVVIVSGLAIGVDSVAHRAALEIGGLCLAVLPGAVENVIPSSNEQLAERIVANGGALASEYPQGTATFKPNFVARNRIVAGLCDVLLITEATDRSGTVHTAKFASKQDKIVLAVPGNITSPTSIGTNSLLKKDAKPATDVNDILRALQMSKRLSVDSVARVTGNNDQEQLLIDLLEQGVGQGSQLLAKSGMSVQQFGHHLTMLEINAKVRSLGANNWALA